jgi:hypothetical protein
MGERGMKRYYIVTRDNLGEIGYVDGADNMEQLLGLLNELEETEGVVVIYGEELKLKILVEPPEEE